MTTVAIMRALTMGILSLSVCGQSADAQEPSVKVITTSVRSSGAHKECISLTTTQSLRYWLRADAAVDFNLQYQDDSGVVMPVKRDKVAIASGSFQAKSRNVYCMVITNQSRQPVTVRLEFARVER